MSPPVRVGLGFASDTIYSPFQQTAFLGMVNDAVNMLRQVITRETGLRGQAYAMDFDVRQWNSSKTMLQLQTGFDGAVNNDQTCVMPDGSREGLDQNTVFDDMGKGLGWTQREDPTLPSRNARWGVILGQGGGYAGGSTQWDSGVAADGTFGFMVLGDWGPYATIFGHGSACCIAKYGTGFCEPLRPLDDLMHEFYHAMGIDSHNPYIRGLDPWSDKQCADFIANNQQFIHPASVTVPPVPVPVVIGIAVTPNPVVVKIGQTIDVDTFLLYSDGTRADANHMDSLSIVNARVAKVDAAANTLTGLRQGSTELLVSAAGQSLHVPVNVKKRGWW